jgi:predicted GH43/DUF377 family glycosyl hydrolase
MKRDIVRRYGHNPILTKAEIPYPVETVHNAGVTKYGSEYVMLFRSHLRTGRSIIGLARSLDGFRFTADPEPFLTPEQDSPFAGYEEFGVEDPRVTGIDGEYLITYSAYSRNGVRVALARTKDFRQVERVSLITQADYRNVVIFPERFDGLYARLDRPHSEIAPWSIWISYSPDLRFWGQSELIMKPEPYHWDEMKIGPGAPPIKTDQGWLSIYHGVFRTMDGAVYRLGVALHDLQNPAKIIGDGEDLLGRRRHGHVCGRGRCVRSGCPLPASQQTRKIGMAGLPCGIAENISWHHAGPPPGLSFSTCKDHFQHRRSNQCGCDYHYYRGRKGCIVDYFQQSSSAGEDETDFAAGDHSDAHAQPVDSALQYAKPAYLFSHYGSDCESRGHSE